MKELPHTYQVTASNDGAATITVNTAGAPSIKTAAPVEFGGPGNTWTPESLLTAAVADCFVLTFKAYSAASKLPWISLQCSVDGVLDKVGRNMAFSKFIVTATLTLPADGSTEKAQRILERSEKQCLITNSLQSDVELITDITVE